MRLQIENLDGPAEIHLTPSYGFLLNELNSRTVFTCTLNRICEENDPCALTVRLLFYDQIGSYLQNKDQILTVPWKTGIMPVFPAKIPVVSWKTMRQFSFKLIPPETLAGSYFYVQAIIEDPTPDAEEVSFKKSAFHETIKKIYVYTEKQIVNVYWSENEQIKDENPDIKEKAITNTGANEEAFLHIKTKGMYSDTVALVISAGDTVLKESTVTLERNRKSVVIRMTDVIARYRQETNSEDNPAIKATVGFRNPRSKSPSDNAGIGAKIVKVLELLTPYIFLNSFGGKGKAKKQNTDLYTKSSELLNICPDVDKPRQRALSSTVYVRVKDSSGKEIQPTRFQDFEMGYVGLLKGTANIHPGKGGSWSVGGVARYPFIFYPLRLIDLVESEVLSIEEACEMSMKADKKTRKTEQEMKDDFDKYKKINDKSILQRLLVNDIINEAIVRKILHHAMRRPAARTYEVCRDAWQNKGKGTGVNPAIRYAANGAECPPGGYTINFVPATFEIYFSNKATRSSALSVTKDGKQYNRSGLAIHRGDSYFATGCTTLYCEYNTPDDKKIQAEILKFLFDTDKRGDAPTHDKKWLILACIDQRHGLKSQNWNARWYDSIAPGKCIRNITGPALIDAGETATYSLNLDKSTLAPGDTVTSEEAESICWKYKIGGGAWTELPINNGKKAIVLTADEKWGGKTLTVRACVTMSFNNSDYKEFTTAVIRKKTQKK
jgi:hypothetical protein